MIDLLACIVVFDCSPAARSFSLLSGHVVPQSPHLAFLSREGDSPSWHRGETPRMYLLLLAVGWQQGPTLPHRIRRTQRSPLCVPWKEEYPAPQPAAEQFSGLKHLSYNSKFLWASNCWDLTHQLVHHFPKTL